MLSELSKLKHDVSSLLGGTLNQKKPPYKWTWVLYRLLSYEFFTVFFFRLSTELYQYRYLRPIALLVYALHKLLFKVDMHPAAKIGRGLQLVHGFSIVIGAGTKIGENVAIFDSVSFGKKNVGEIGGMPIVGDDVILGTGAKILGEIKIADASIVGANSVVISSFERKGSVIAGVPARCISPEAKD